MKKAGKPADVKQIRAGKERQDGETGEQDWRKDYRNQAEGIVRSCVKREDDETDCLADYDWRAGALDGSYGVGNSESYLCVVHNDGSG